MKQYVYRWLIRWGIRSGMALYLGLIWLATCLGSRKNAEGERSYDILLTGTFYSENWISAHLRPLAMSRYCRRLQVVSVYPVPNIDKVMIVRPPSWLIKLLGAVPARLATFGWIALRDRPDIVGGFHLLFNGLAAALTAKIIGSRSLYFCVGGPAEVLNGGLLSENRVFEKLGKPDQIVEKQLLRAVSAFDFVITMGNRAIRFFRKKGVHTNFHIISGGLDNLKYNRSTEPPEADVIWVGRLAHIKRLDLFLQAVNLVRNLLPSFRALVVGEGPCRDNLKRMAEELGLNEHVDFVGFQKDVASWIKKAKVFVLTSESEGLSLAMIEAMLCGLPAVVSWVGDLEELVEDGVNGYLVSERTPQAFAAKLLELLNDSQRLADVSSAARQSAERYELTNAARLWDSALSVVERSD